jgi:hypothetical protein
MRNIGSFRRNKRVRIFVILILLITVGVIFFMWEKARIAAIIAFIALVAALGLEITESDWDLSTMEKVPRNENGDLLIGAMCDDPDFDYNCADFDTQEEAQSVMDVCGDKGVDVHRLDGDGNGIACQSLPRER